ncbi:hypothetical protein LRS13_03830 [Svornostia abyssi]|uniref:Uncharacterized protein n=1 Tax=Svornostia abyssi TaxID=2898438 RepID=A0ABY5PK04_9ACTN|nr:hypothetical protein LRS13_03830 [Parviterribacteraceae bacterium J379]
MAEAEQQRWAEQIADLRRRVTALESTLAAVVAHTGYVPPVEPAIPPEAQAQLDRGNRAGAIAEYAKARGVSRHLAEQAIDAATRRDPAAAE